MGTAKPERKHTWLQEPRLQAEASALQQASVAEMRPAQTKTPAGGTGGCENQGVTDLAAVGVFHGVLGIADDVAGSALRFVELPFGLQLAVAGRAANGVLHCAFNLVGSAFYMLLVHACSPYR
jgi:hypothetical protein